MGIYIPKNPKWETEKSIIVKCDIAFLDHELYFEYYTDDDDPFLIIVTSLTKQTKLLKRIWQSILYILGYRSRFGCFSEVLVTQETAGLLVEFLQEFSELPVNREEK